jgi:hypothetical protein
MTDLIATLSGLTGPDREVDARICRRLAGNPKDHWYDFLGVWTTDNTCPELTASLDAITALVERVLPGCDWEAEKWDGRGIAGINSGANETAATPVIALCIAILKAVDGRDGN